MKKRYCDVIVDVSAGKLDHPFTYRLPASLAEEVAAGSVVRIPFGSGGRVVRGYVVGFREEAGIPEASVKDVLSAETGIETTESKLVALAAWMSRTCGSSMLQALKTVLVAKRRYGPKTSAMVSAGDRDILYARLEEARRRHWDAQERVLSAMAEQEGAVPLPELAKAASVPASVIRTLARSGVLILDE